MSMHGWKMGCVALFFAGVAGSAPAQVEVSLSIPTTLFLEMEPVTATVVVSNLTGDPIRLGGTNSNARLRLDIERFRGDLIRDTGEPVVPEAVEIPPHGKHTFELNILDLYQVRRSGPHSINARLVMGEENFYSEQFLFDVVPGLELRKTEVLTREADGRRRLSLTLKELSRDREEWIFLRIDELQAGICHGVYNLGTIIRMTPPQIAIDRDNRVHVLHHSAPTRFTHHVFSIDGLPIQVEYFSGTASEAKLATSDEGVVEVIGVRPYEGDPFAAPLRGATRLWRPADVAPPKKDERSAAGWRKVNKPGTSGDPSKDKTGKP